LRPIPLLPSVIALAFPFMLVALVTTKQIRMRLQHLSSQPVHAARA